MRLFINNRHIPLKPFLSNFVKQIILSMVFNLKDTGKPEKIELILEKTQEEEGGCVTTTNRAMRIGHHLSQSSSSSESFLPANSMAPSMA